MSTLADFTLNVAPPTGAYFVGYTSASAGGEIRTPLASLLSGLHLNPTLQGYTLTAAPAIPSTTMGATVIDVTKPINSAIVSGSPTLTFSSLTPAAGTVLTLELSAISGDATVTVPTGYSFNRGGDITSIVVPNNTSSSTTWRYNGARWDVRGDPVASVGAGSYVKANSGNFISAVFNSPTAGSKVYTRMPFNANAVGYSILADGVNPTGSFDIWQVAGTALPTVANTIMGTRPILTAGNAFYTGVISNWAPLSGNSLLAINCDAMTGATYAELKVYLTRT